MSQDELKKALQTARLAHERETELTYTITSLGALLRAVELLAERQNKPSEADSGVVAKLEQKIKMQHAQIGELEAQDRRAGELLAKTHAAHVAAEARVAELEQAWDMLKKSLDESDLQRNEGLTKIAELEKRIADLTAPVTVDGKTPGQVALEGRTFARIFPTCNDCGQMKGLLGCWCDQRSK